MIKLSLLFYVTLLFNYNFSYAEGTIKPDELHKCLTALGNDIPIKSTINKIPPVSVLNNILITNDKITEMECFKNKENEKYCSCDKIAIGYPYYNGSLYGIDLTKNINEKKWDPYDCKNVSDEKLKAAISEFYTKQISAKNKRKLGPEFLGESDGYPNLGNILDVPGLYRKLNQIEVLKKQLQSCKNTGVAKLMALAETEEEFLNSNYRKLVKTKQSFDRVCLGFKNKNTTEGINNYQTK